MVSSRICLEFAVIFLIIPQRYLGKTIGPTVRESPHNSLDNVDLLQLLKAEDDTLTHGFEVESADVDGTNEDNDTSSLASDSSSTSGSAPLPKWLRQWKAHAESTRQVVVPRSSQTDSFRNDTGPKSILGPNIPLPIWITAKVRPDAVIAWNAKYLPNNADFHFLDDEGMDKMVLDMSAELESEGIADGIYEAFKCLVPPAYKADLFRAVVMYVHGGLYMDHKIKLVANIDTWVNLEIDQVVVPSAKMPVQSSLLYSIPRHPLWPLIIRRIVSNIKNQYYGEHATDPTGPGVVYSGLQAFGKSDGIRRDLVFHRPNGGLDLDNKSVAVQEYHKLGMSACFRIGDQIVAGDDADLHSQNQASSTDATHSLYYAALWKQRRVYSCGGAEKRT